MPVTPLLSTPQPEFQTTNVTSTQTPEFTTPSSVAPPAGAPQAQPAQPSGLLQLPAPTPASASGYTPSTYQATPYTSKGYESSPYKVEKDGLVQNRVLDLVANDSPLMQQAMTKARQTMQARGLLNSSLAIQAGQEGVLSKALEIANPDAAAINNAMVKTGDAENAERQFNTGAENAALTNTANQQNAASQFNAGATNTAGQFNAGAENNANLANLQAQNQAFMTSLNNVAQLANTKLNTDTQIALGNLDASTKVALTNLDNQNRQLLQSSTSASQAYVQAITNIANISQSNTMNQAAKDAAINTQINLLRQQLGVIGGIASTAPQAVQNLNLGQYFQTTNADGGQVSAGTPGSSPYNGSIPDGGYRDAQGNVYNADGTRASWQGPPGMAVDYRNGTPVSTPTPTGTVTNPSTVTAANWKPGMPAPPGYRLDNRGGRIVKI